MVDIVAGPLLDNPALRAQGLDALPTTTGDAMAAVAGDTLHDNLAGRLFRGLSQESATTLAQGEQEGTVSGATTPDGRPVGALLSADQANERYGIRGQLSFDNPVAESVAEDRYQAARDRLARQSVLMRAPDNVTTTAAKIATGIGTGLLDPIQDAAMFIPFVGEARAANWMATAGPSLLGRTAVRAGIGAIEGAAGTAAVQPVQWGLTRSEGEDFKAVDALLNVAYGGAGGALLHAGGGLAHDLVRGVPQPDAASAAAMPAGEGAPSAVPPSPLPDATGAPGAPAAPPLPEVVGAHVPAASSLADATGSPRLPAAPMMDGVPGGAPPPPGGAGEAGSPLGDDLTIPALRQQDAGGAAPASRVAPSSPAPAADGLPPGYMLRLGGLDADTAALISHLQGRLADEGTPAGPRAELQRQLDQVTDSVRPELDRARSNLAARAEDDGRMVRALLAEHPPAPAEVEQQLAGQAEAGRRLAALHQVVLDSLPLDAKEAAMRTALGEMARNGQVDGAAKALAEQPGLAARDASSPAPAVPSRPVPAPSELLGPDTRPRMPSDDEVSAMARRATTAPAVAPDARVAADLQRAEETIRQLQAAGIIPADDPHVALANAAANDAEATARAYQAAAGCLMMGGML